MDPDFPGVELDPVLLERFRAASSLSEALNDLVEAIAGDPEAERAFDPLTAALQRWLDAAAVARDD